MAELPEIKAMSIASSVSVKNSNRGGDTTQEGICVYIGVLNQNIYNINFPNPKKNKIEP